MELVYQIIKGNGVKKHDMLTMRSLHVLDAFLSFLAEQVQPDSIPECSGPRAGEAGV